jgi:hypothetical protein
MNQQSYSDSDVNKYRTKYGSERERVNMEVKEKE